MGCDHILITNVLIHMMGATQSGNVGGYINMLLFTPRPVRHTWVVVVHHGKFEMYAQTIMLENIIHILVYKLLWRND